MRHGSLFSGIGGFDLAAEWMGWQNIFHCEREPFAQKVLKHHFPNSKLYEDIKTFDASNYFGRVDIISGGFPCQPFSSAGRRLGSDDERNLWPEMFRIIKEVSPRFVVGENVYGLLSWSGGLVFEQVCTDLESEGYEVTPFILPAAGKNAPHLRKRIFFVAHSDNGRHKEPIEKLCSRGHSSNCGCQGVTANAFSVGGVQNDWQRVGKSKLTNEISEAGDVANTLSNGLHNTSKSRNLQKSAGTAQKKGGSDSKPSKATCRKRGFANAKKHDSKTIHKPPRNLWENFPTQPPICGGDDGLSEKLDTISFSKWRNESIKAYGNAIVPSVAHEIFKAIQKTIT
tara:strand:- start:920 stop:1942 length:1023 start_codon:yes stop_codon:yes gene_type:complete